MDAIITAGGIPTEEDLLYEYTQGGNKAMLDLAGKPMIQWVLDAVSDSKSVERAVIVGLDEDSGLNCSKEIAYILGAKTRKDGYFEGNGYAVTWTFGHFCTLKTPDDYHAHWKKWDLNI